MISLKKISAIAASTLLAGMTMGLAAAASASTTFVDGGSANVAMVYGANALNGDQVAAGNIKEKLTTYVSSSESTTVSGGDSYKFEKSSTKFHLGDNITSVISGNLDDDELPTLLGEGKYIDNDNDEFDYTQSITMGSAVQLGMFDDDDYKEDSPTVGFNIPSGTTVLTYTLSFSDEPTIADLATTELPIMDKSYYVLSNSSSGANLILTLLDSASSAILAEGDTKTVDGKEVSVNFISSTEVILEIDGQNTNSLAEGQTQKLSDGSYIGIKDILYSSKDTGISKVEFSIGSGKLVLTSGSEVQINDDAISGLTTTITNTTTLTSIAIAWAADEDLFITEDSSITMPGFGAVKLAYGGLTYPAEEVIEVKQGGTTYAVLDNFPLKDGEADINFLYGDSTSFTGLGKDSTNKLVTAATGANLTFNANNVDDYFVVSYNDGSDAESYLMRATNFIIDGTNNKTDFQYYKDGSWSDKKTGAKDGDTFSIGNAEVVVYTVTKVGSTKTVLIGNNSVNTNFNQLWSAEGLKVQLPVVNSSTVSLVSADNITGMYSTAAQACGNIPTINATGSLYTGTLSYTVSTTNLTATTSACATTFNLVMNEEDKNGNKAHADGDQINVTLGWDSSTTAEVEVSALATENNADAGTGVEIGDTDVWIDFTYSALATELLWNKPDSGQKSVKVIYHGDEVAADVYVTSEGATMSTGAADIMIVTDEEVSSVSAKQLVVVGGSCINSVAAQLVGGAYCGDSFSDATGVGSGEFLIKGYASGINGRFALLVAGYEVADTTAAATYLIENIGTMDVSKAYKGTTVTSAVTEVTSA